MILPNNESTLRVRYVLMNSYLCRVEWPRIFIPFEESNYSSKDRGINHFSNGVHDFMILESHEFFL